MEVVIQSGRIRVDIDLFGDGIVEGNFQVVGLHRDFQNHAFSVSYFRVLNDRFFYHFVVSQDEKTPEDIVLTQVENYFIVSSDTKNPVVFIDFIRIVHSNYELQDSIKANLRMVNKIHQNRIVFKSVSCTGVIVIQVHYYSILEERLFFRLLGCFYIFSSRLRKI